MSRPDKETQPPAEERVWDGERYGIVPATFGLPFGRKARARRAARSRVREQVAARNERWREEFDDDLQEAAPLTAPWQPVDRRQNFIAVAALGGVVALVIGAAIWVTMANDGDEQGDQKPVAAPSADVDDRVTQATTEPTTTPAPAGAGSSSLPQLDPIPSDGVDPIEPPADGVAVDPDTVKTVSPPAGAPTRAELATPESAAVAWLGRWCAFDAERPMASQYDPAEPAMTPEGWEAFNPANTDAAERDWRQREEAREFGRCSKPTARVSPEAPRTNDSAMVIITAQRVVDHHGGGKSYVEEISLVYGVERGQGGLWRVGFSSQGAG